AQVEEFLSRAGDGLVAVRTALQYDPVLQEMASTPLMLSTIAFTYRDQSIDAVLSGGSLAERRHIILNNYIERVLERRSPQKAYTLQQTKQYLTWLAHQMLRHGQGEFYVER